MGQSAPLMSRHYCTHNGASQRTRCVWSLIWTVAGFPVEPIRIAAPILSGNGIVNTPLGCAESHRYMTPQTLAWMKESEAVLSEAPPLTSPPCTSWLLTPPRDNFCWLLRLLLPELPSSVCGPEELSNARSSVTASLIPLRGTLISLPDSHVALLPLLNHRVLSLWYNYLFLAP